MMIRPAVLALATLFSTQAVAEYKAPSTEQLAAEVLNWWGVNLERLRTMSAAQGIAHVACQDEAAAKALAPTFIEEYGNIEAVHKVTQDNKLPYRMHELIGALELIRYGYAAGLEQALKQYIGQANPQKKSVLCAKVATAAKDVEAHRLKLAPEHLAKVAALATDEQKKLGKEYVELAEGSFTYVVTEKIGARLPALTGLMVCESEADDLLSKVKIAPKEFWAYGVGYASVVESRRPIFAPIEAHDERFAQVAFSTALENYAEGYRVGTKAALGMMALDQSRAACASFETAASAYVAPSRK